MRKRRPEDKLPQNLRDILETIGEYSVLFHLYTIAYDKGWKVVKNIDEPGCDILLLNLNTNNMLKIEVKTRQTMYTTAKSKKTENKRLFQLTRNEYDNCDFVVCYWFDKNAYFIIPKSEIDDTKTTIRIRISESKKGDGFIGKYGKYKDSWNLIEKRLRT